MSWPAGFLVPEGASFSSGRVLRRPDLPELFFTVAYCLVIRSVSPVNLPQPKTFDFPAGTQDAMVDLLSYRASTPLKDNAMLERQRRPGRGIERIQSTFVTILSSTYVFGVGKKEVRRKIISSSSDLHIARYPPLLSPRRHLDLFHSSASKPLHDTASCGHRYSG